MSELETQSISREQFLTICTNLLYRAFVKASRTDAKKLFREISDGRPVRLTQLEMEDRSMVEFQISMDHSEFRGKLNYGAFRASIGNLLGNIAQTLEQKKEIQTFGAENNENSMIFGVTGLTVEDDQPNVLALSTTTAVNEANVMMRLMYLDPEQFVQRAGSGDAQDTA